MLTIRDDYKLSKTVCFGQRKESYNNVNRNHIFEGHTCEIIALQRKGAELYSHPFLCPISSYPWSFKCVSLHWFLKITICEAICGLFSLLYSYCILKEAKYI